jgi:UDP-N-acetylglucosamine 1-carboxyvinyltransferase|tara:strand:+ start:6222 stop:7481 length:1260 start_codon:yes stop_codon:yes gene_type:complete
MDYFEINGKKQLNGEVEISGAKNAVLPLMAAGILNSKKLQIINVPYLSDSSTMAKLLESMGAKVAFDSHNSITVDSSSLDNPFASYDLVKTMRASFYVLGPLIAKFGYAKVSLPGGCAWGPRPVDFHLDGFKALGVDIKIENGYVIARAKEILGNKIHFPKISVGATGNVIMAAVLANGITTLSNAAAEPEIQQLCNMLNSMGAKIEGIGSNTLKIEGVHSLDSIDKISVIPDRIEAGTFMIAAAAVGGKVKIKNIIPEHLDSLSNYLKKAKVQVDIGSDYIFIKSDGRTIVSTDMETNEYPGFPTDLQAQWMTLMCLADGVSTIKENIYYDRFTHIMELNRLNCDIRLENSIAKIQGNQNLVGADVMSTDIRASAALIIAALCAEGKTKISRIYHIDRGYDKIEEKLSNLGAEIIRKK